ncbi:MAG TPA: hypothetical protein VGO65_12105 [Pseudolysinimonas sp.]|nr:hypothetical protein [Pseudolysinimonas sp.]
MSNPAGTWKVHVATPFGDQDLTIEIVVDGEDVSGTATHSAGTFPFSGGTYRDDKVVFEVALTAPVQADLKVKVRADGDTLTGKARAGLMSFKVTGTRA